jgi:MATE family multidrug resistance protein
MALANNFTASHRDPAPVSGSWREEMIETSRLAWPMALTQLGQVVMMTTDLAMLGRLGDEVIAAASLAHTVLFAAFVLGMGLVSAVAPLAAQGYGARKPRIVRRALRVGLWAAVLLGLPLSVAQLWGNEMLLAAGQTPEMSQLASRYLAGLAWSLVPAWAFIALRGFMGAVNRPEPALWITLVAVPANAALAYGLIYGVAGLPELDLLGAGIATTVINLAMCAAAVWIAWRRRPFRKYHAFGRWWRPDWSLMKRLLGIGFPISGAFVLEYGLFAAASLIMGWIGTTALAAHQIALQTSAILFMVPFGISMAATVRVGQAVGRRDAAASRRAGFAALLLAALFMIAMTLMVAWAREVIPVLFLGASAVEAPETLSLASLLLVVGATFFVFDGLQTVGAGALRGLNDTRVPLLFAAVSFWGIGFTSSYVLGFSLGRGALGVWIGLSLALGVFATLLVWRFHALTRRRYLPAVP